jgi:hypothetical protein
MPRDTESIRHALHTNPSEAPVSYGGLGSIWNIYPNSIGVPAGSNNGRFNTLESLKKVQKRYWAKGIPMGMELELELPENFDNTTCSCNWACSECNEGYHGDCEEGSCDRDSGSYRFYRDYEPVRNVMELINKNVETGMKNFAMRQDNDYFHYINTISAKGDGSLDNGVEFNLQPFTKSAFIKYAASAWQDVGYQHFEGFSTSTAGIHIHLPKAAFNDVEIFMWLLLMENLGYTNHPSNGLSFLSIIGQREPVAYGRLNSRSSAAQLLDAVENRRWYQGRGLQVNFNGHGNTIELRLFKAQQLPHRLIKNYAFVDMTWRYVHLLMDFVEDEKYSQAMQFLSNTDMFMGYIMNPNAKGYNDYLAGYINKRWKRTNGSDYTFTEDMLPTLRTLNERFQSRDWEVTETQDNNSNTEEVSSE